MPLELTIVHGNIPDLDVLVDEPHIMIQNREVKAEREEKLYKAADKVTRGALYTDPKLTMELKGIVSEYEGLVIQHPGTSIAELQNFQAEIFGFDPEDGTMIYKDPSLSADTENPEMISFTMLHLPFCEPASSGA